MQTLDLLVIVAYLGATAWLGLKLSGRQTGMKDYFLGGRNLPWWAVCLSVVATETSALTVIGIPVMSYLGDISYLQLGLGYIIGRVIVAYFMLPRYYNGEMVTAYAYLGQRFGQTTQTTAGVTFLFTRLLADGIRVLAAAIPLKLILGGMGIEADYFTIIVVLSVVTIAYTLIGGIKAVVWVDVFQMFLYVGGGILSIAVISAVSGGWFGDAVDAGKLAVFSFEGNPISSPGSFVASLVGGAVFAMASHGSDQLIVQRLLTCRTKVEAQKALIWSGILVFVQFSIFLLVGLALWTYYEQASPASLGLSRDDEIFPLFIIEGLPPGVTGLLFAGILAAAMSTLSSSLSALSSSTVTDVYGRFRKKTPMTDREGLRVGRWATIGWGLAFIAPATVFQSDEGNIVILALGVAGITYGGLLGAFVFGIANKRARAADANIAFVAAIAVNAFFFVMEKYVTGEVWVAWQWYPLMGVLVTFLVGGLLSLRHPAPDTEEPVQAAER